MWLVGGRDQTAILTKGAVLKVDFDQQLFERRKTNTTKFSMFTDLTVEGKLSTIVSLPPGVIGLYLKSRFQDSLIYLDSKYFFGNTFKSTIFYYEGGVFGFDASNQLIQCVLRLGPHVDRDSPAVQELMAIFQRKMVN